MSITKQLNEIVAERSLLNHPFYQAWSAGTLPVEDLQTYAREYGAFIEMLPRAWETLKDAETSQEEVEHAGGVGGRGLDRAGRGRVAGGRVAISRARAPRTGSAAGWTLCLRESPRESTQAALV